VIVRTEVIMIARQIPRLLAVAALAAVPAVAQAAADLNFREFRLQHVCKGGPTPGIICCGEPDECGAGGTCIVDARTRVSGKLTIIVEDDVGGIDGSKLDTEVHAVTTLLELGGKKGPALAQTFQRLDDTDLATMLTELAKGPPDEFGFAVSEGLLETFVDSTGLGTPLDISFLIYRTLDAESLREMRVNAGLDPDGPELLVIDPKGLKLERWVDHFEPTVPGDNTSPDTDEFGSVLRVKIKGFFVLPKPTECF
jgi:hypothetical protein